RQGGSERGGMLVSQPAPVERDRVGAPSREHARHRVEGRRHRGLGSPAQPRQVYARWLLIGGTRAQSDRSLSGDKSRRSLRRDLANHLWVAGRLPRTPPRQDDCLGFALAKVVILGQALWPFAIPRNQPPVPAASPISARDALALHLLEYAFSMAVWQQGN